MEKQIGKNELTCNDCLKCDNLGLGVYFCDDTIDIISPDQPACQLILRKGNATPDEYLRNVQELQTGRFGRPGDV